MNIRNFQPGDELIQVEIYNQAAASLAKFKAATLGEVQRRVKARDFDPATRFYAEEAGQVRGYVTYNSNGRVSFPWTVPGYEKLREPLFQTLMAALARRGHRRLFTAYREDWPSIHQFFLDHGFRKKRDMVNFVMNLVDMPTPAARPSTTYTPLEPADLPDLLALAPEVLLVHDLTELRRWLLSNPYFPADNLFVLRSRTERTPVAVGILVNDLSYADPTVLDANMPCFRLGAFGTEGMQTKRVKGMFSFLAKQDRNLNQLAMDLLGQASYRLRDDDIGTLAAQVPSDAPALLNFYNRTFTLRGSFPIFEKS
jgi:hypothetical protein